MGKIGLVLEGGGMRGAYTAGVLDWLIEHEMVFDYVVGISSGALYSGMYSGMCDLSKVNKNEFNFMRDPNGKSEDA